MVIVEVGELRSTKEGFGTDYHISCSCAGTMVPRYIHGPSFASMENLCALFCGWQRAAITPASYMVLTHLLHISSLHTCLAYGHFKNFLLLIPPRSTQMHTQNPTSQILHHL